MSRCPSVTECRQPRRLFRSLLRHAGPLETHARSGLACMLAAALTVACLSFFGGCSGDTGDQPISSETSKYQVAEGDSSAAGSSTSSGEAPVTLEAEGGGDLSSPSRPGGGTPVSGRPRPDQLAPGNAGREDLPPAVQQPPSVPGAALNAYTVPEGTPEQLMEFIRNLPQRPQGASTEEFMADYRNILSAAVEAADKILAADAEPSIREDAARVKLNSLTRLASELQLAEAVPQIRTFSQQLRQDANPELAGLGRLTLFGLQIGDFASGGSGDAEQLVRELDGLLANRQMVDSKAEDVFGVTLQAALVLQRAGKMAEAEAAFAKIAATFDNHPNEAIAPNVADLKEYLTFVKTDFSTRQDAALMGEADAVAPFLETVKQVLGAETRGRMTLNRVREAGHYMEITHNTQAAREIYTLLGQAFEGHQDQELATQAAEAMAGGLRRIDLIGKPFRVEGQLADGTPFDWNQYRGKVVLVDFWASWCGPCREEFPNIARQYERYRDKGFEVIGVNLDEDPAERQRFLESQGLPWPTVISADPEAQGFDNPLAVRCGIEAIPFLVLVNREGIAIATHTRGEELAERLAELLGPAPETTQPPATGATGATGGGAVRPASAERPAPNSSGSLDHGGRLHPAGGFEQKEFEQEETVWFISLEDDSLENDQSDPADTSSGSAEETGQAKTEEEPGKEEELPIDPAINPYAAPSDLSPLELIDYILDMQEKPETIQRRPGFADAVAEAADRVLAAEASDKYHTIAALAKFQILHDAASFDDAQADAKLAAFVERMKEDPRPKIAQEVQFLKLERKVLGVDDLPLDQVSALLDEVHAYLADQKLTERHLRIASQTVHAINRLADGDQREEQFLRFGKLFAESSSRELARYGKKLAKSSPSGGSDLVGKPLELAGVTTLGTEFDWEAYRGKVVLVDFWATWCGPCRKAMPKVKALHEKLGDRPFDVVGVSLDQDLDALAQYLADNKIAWTNLAGEETQEIARKYNVRGIPTMMLVDTQGNIVAVSHNIEELSGRIDMLLKDGEKAADE